MRTPLDILITAGSLGLIESSPKGRGMDFILDELDKTGGSPEIKNVCAKVSVRLSDEIDQICGLLDISKRRFLEVAFIEAIDKAKEIMNREGVWDYLEENHSPKDGAISTRQGAA